MINIILESFGSERFFGGIEKLYHDPYIFLCNTLIIASTISVGVFFKRFRPFVVGLVSSIWLFLGAINFIILSNRTLPFTAYDLQLLDTFPHLMRRYLSPTLLALACLLLVVVLLGIAIVFFKALAKPKPEPKKGKARFITPIVSFVAVCSVTFGNLQYAIGSGILETRFAELPKSFTQNGFAYSFILGAVDSGVKEVDGYSKELIDSLVDDTKLCPEKTPNVVIIQLESFFDLNSLNSVEFSSDPHPNFTRLAAENPSGRLTVPVIGAGTANTEFEVMTGMRIADFGAGEYPYKTVLIENTCESIATNLKPYDYTAHFIHNYKATFYGRNIVYSNLGFDNFYSIEYMTGAMKNENGWARDQILLRYINECLDSTEGHDLVTTVTVQAHGSYADIADYERHVKVTKCDNDSLRSSFQYYANQIYETDRFLGELMNSLAAREEETILLVYGDHLPTLGIEDEQLKGRNVYQTDYFIWNNAGIEYASEDLYSYQLSSKILESLNIKDGVINSCHQKYKGSSKYLYNLQALEYDTLYGEKYAYDGENPYYRAEMKVNQKAIKIHSISRKEGAENRLIIKGEGFSEDSFITVGMRITPTQFIDENTLEITAAGIEPTDPIKVCENNVGSSEEYFWTDE